MVFKRKKYSRIYVVDSGSFYQQKFFWASGRVWWSRTRGMKGKGNRDLIVRGVWGLRTLE
jgi:hypothetical protein